MHLVTYYNKHLIFRLCLQHIVAATIKSIYFESSEILR